MRPAPERHLFPNVISLLFYVRLLSSYSFLIFIRCPRHGHPVVCCRCCRRRRRYTLFRRLQQQVRTVPSEPKTSVVVGSTPSIVLLAYIVRARPAHPPHVVSGRRRSVSFYCSTTTRARVRTARSVRVRCTCFLPLSLFFDFIFRSIVSFFNIFQSLPLPKLRCRWRVTLDHLISTPKRRCRVLATEVIIVRTFSTSSSSVKRHLLLF